MATSPNFAWPEPDDTDFVYLGASQIRDLGDAIDATVNVINYTTIVTPHPFLLMGA